MENESKQLFSLPSDFNLVAAIVPDKPSSKRINSGIVSANGRRQRVSLEGKVGSIVDARNYRGNGHWEWIEGELLGGKGYIGFIYVIYDTVNQRLYLGKKQYKGMGKLNKGQDSNWRWYISSSKELSESVKLNEKQGFRYIAIEEYKTKGGLSYAETWSLCHVQTPVYRDKWYNVLINKVTWSVKEPPTDRHKVRLHAIMNEAEAP